MGIIATVVLEFHVMYRRVDGSYKLATTSGNFRDALNTARDTSLRTDVEYAEVIRDDVLRVSELRRAVRFRGGERV